MIKPFISTLFITLVGYTSHAQSKKVCFSIDDLPVVNYGIDTPHFKDGITDRLIAAFDKYDIPAIGYVNERKLFRYYKEDVLKKSETALLEKWLSAGYELGNHTYSHLSYHKVSFDEYTENVIKGATITPKLSKKHKLPYRYFRHPFLHAGNTKGAYDSLSQFLETHNFTIAPVTIDNDDYLFAKAYSDAYKAGDKALQNKIGASFLSYMKEKILYFEGRSEALFGRNMAHTLLLHANLLNSDYLGDLAEVFIELGYTFVSQEEVLKDPLYQTEITRFGSWGISWIDRWALSQGKKGEFFKGDPETPQFVKDLTK